MPPSYRRGELYSGIYRKTHLPGSQEGYAPSSPLCVCNSVEEDAVGPKSPRSYLARSMLCGFSHPHQLRPRRRSDAHPKALPARRPAENSARGPRLGLTAWIPSSESETKNARAFGHIGWRPTGCIFTTSDATRWVRIHLIDLLQIVCLPQPAQAPSRPIAGPQSPGRLCAV